MQYACRRVCTLTSHTLQFFPVTRSRCARSKRINQWNIIRGPKRSLSQGLLKSSWYLLSNSQTENKTFKKVTHCNDVCMCQLFWLNVTQQRQKHKSNPHIVLFLHKPSIYLPSIHIDTYLPSPHLSAVLIGEFIFWCLLRPTMCIKLHTFNDNI